MSEAGDPWTVIVLAGSRPGIDPLAAHFGVRSKALIPIDGEPMLSRVLRTLYALPRVGRVVLLAQNADAIAGDPAMAELRADPRFVPLASGGGISRSVMEAVERLERPWPILVTTADNALLTPEIVAHFLDGAQEGDLAVGLVSRTTLLADYPDNKRTWLEFKGEAYTGANLFALRSANALRALEMWEKVEQDRKSLLRVASRFGPWLLLRVLLRVMPLREAIAQAGRRLGLDARAVVLPFADAGIDVDKPSDHALAQAILERRRQGAA